MVKIVKNCCSPYYLDMMILVAQNSDNWNFKYPQGRPFSEKHLKLDLIENDIKNPLLAGMAMGLLIQIFDKCDDVFLPECSFCGISIKDKHRKDNIHTDHDHDKDHIKILGLLNSDWNSEDGGFFIHGDEEIPMEPTNFVIFDPRVPHACSEILTDKKRFGVDFTVRAK